MPARVSVSSTARLGFTNTSWMPRVLHRREIVGVGLQCAVASVLTKLGQKSAFSLANFGRYYDGERNEPVDSTLTAAQDQAPAVEALAGAILG